MPKIENFVQNWKFCPKLKILSKIENFVENWKFCRKLKILLKLEICQKLKILSKINIDNLASMAIWLKTSIRKTKSTNISFSSEVSKRRALRNSRHLIALLVPNRQIFSTVLRESPKDVTIPNVWAKRFWFGKYKHTKTIIVPYRKIVPIVPQNKITSINLFDHLFYRRTYQEFDDKKFGKVSAFLHKF